MSTTRVPLNVVAYAYPGSDADLLQYPHYVVVDWGQGKPLTVYFWTLCDLQSTLNSAVDNDGVPRVAADKAMDAAWGMFAGRDPTEAMMATGQCGAARAPECSKDGAARNFDWLRAACVYVGLVGYVAAVWLGAKFLVEWAW